MSGSAAGRGHSGERGACILGIPEEIHIDVPWGHLSGLAWGPADGLPVLCLHGWMDNANTYLNLVPMLPADRRYIALEFSGHGQSSHLPKGSIYDQKRYLTEICRTVEALKYSKVSIIGHSMGGVIGSLFSCMFPEMVDKLVLLDIIGFLPLPEVGIAPLPGTPQVVLKSFMDMVLPYGRNLIHEHLRLERKPGPNVYSQDGALRRLLEANTQLSEESGRILLERGTKRVPGGVVFSRDIQVSVRYDPVSAIEQCLVFINNIKARVLTLMATNGHVKDPTFHPELKALLVNGFKSGLKERYELVWIEGNHFVHLNEPEKVAGLISRFLQMEDSSSATGQSRL